MFSRAYGNFEEQNNVLESSIFIINCRIIITNAYYNCVNNAQYNYYIYNEVLLDERDKEANLAVPVAATVKILSSVPYSPIYRPAGTPLKTGSEHFAPFRFV
jgi:hypothetical protein